MLSHPFESDHLFTSDNEDSSCLAIVGGDGDDASSGEVDTDDTRAGENVQEEGSQ